MTGVGKSGEKCIFVAFASQYLGNSGIYYLDYYWHLIGNCTQALDW